MITPIKASLRDYLLNIGFGQMQACELASGFNVDVKAGERQKVDHKGERISVFAEEKNGNIEYKFNLANEGKYKKMAG